jgi:hypothetical protein
MEKSGFPHLPNPKPVLWLADGSNRLTQNTKPLPRSQQKSFSLPKTDSPSCAEQTKSDPTAVAQNPLEVRAKRTARTNLPSPRSGCRSSRNGCDAALGRRSRTHSPPAAPLASSPGSAPFTASHTTAAIFSSWHVWQAQDALCGAGRSNHREIQR